MPSLLQISILSHTVPLDPLLDVLAFLHGNNLPSDRLVESCGTSRLEFLQLGFSNLNSVFNIDIFVADLPGDNVDTILALGDIKGIHITSPACLW